MYIIIIIYYNNNNIQKIAGSLSLGTGLCSHTRQANSLWSLVGLTSASSLVDALLWYLGGLGGWWRGSHGEGLCSEEMGHQSSGHAQQEMIVYSLFFPLHSNGVPPLLFLEAPSGNNYIVHALNSPFCNDNWCNLLRSLTNEALTLLEAIQWVLQCVQRWLLLSRTPSGS